METIGQTLAKKDNHKYDTEKMTQAILSDQEIANFIAAHHLSKEQIKISLPKFNQYRLERTRFENHDQAYIAKGYQPLLVMNEGYADVAYKETKELIAAKRTQAISDRINVVSLPRSYKNISFDDINLDDVKRLDVFKRVADFVEKYPNPEQKGLYLYGDMGIGKSYLMAAMAHELSEQRGAATTLLHFPSFTIDVKNAINTGTVKEEIDAVKTADILILDDIGAEQSTSWIRDEVLQVILQYRMLEELPTFFTSNYSFKDLEAKLANIKGSDETWQAKRVMERIRYLAKEIHLEGENRR
ncbi:primosomal protein DnaI [Streptococcus mutans]|uniref:primosomal protein DnaI n=1 Tax=Streptococcus mutans TaxID=1309 RepID=UPI0002B5FA8B|nr:primosomal protein DnaI [Streptococcus mutans]ARS63230.1 primosomal protein DnaI [Streptococcus mutans]EMC02024.1 primosomal protein DnaI [Streptococcus mutans T4]EMC52056.1 primosomal protein DnaI [Streptococcus mutans SA41]ESS16210.1 putative DNA replication protein [Streptococcus mutans PKUSS-HG01]MCB4926164.1 primosomal protein DnaI [Streptococcus mutans]